MSSFSSFKRPNILTLIGINRKDYNNDFELPSIICDDIIYQNIPTVYKKDDMDYPESTNLLCWNCDRHFSWKPAFVPIAVSDNFEFKVEGNMCSFNCAYSWADTHYHGDTKNRIKDRIYVLYEMVTGRRGKVIYPAPSKTLMKKYGGTLSADEYDKMMNSIMDKL